MMTPLLFHPHFIIKYYLLRSLQDVVKSNAFTGTAMDVGCGEKPYLLLFPDVISYEGIDFKTYSTNKTFARNTPDFYFDKTYTKTQKLPFRSLQFDHTFSFQVAEHHPNPLQHISELVRITKKGGTILLSVPFIWGLHEEPHDYFRYTEYALRSLFIGQNCRIVLMKKQGSIASTLAMLGMDYALELRSGSGLRRILGFFLAVCMLLFSYSCLILDRMFPSERIFLNYVVLAKKL